MKKIIFAILSVSLSARAQSHLPLGKTLYGGITFGPNLGSQCSLVVSEKLADHRWAVSFEAGEVMSSLNGKATYFLVSHQGKEYTGIGLAQKSFNDFVSVDSTQALKIERSASFQAFYKATLYKNGRAILVCSALVDAPY